MSAKHVLLIDDNRDAVESMAMLVEMEGHRVSSAFDGASGLEQAQRDPPDIAVIDIGLPDMSGDEVARRLRSGNGQVFLVALSGRSREDLPAAAAAAFDHHLVKPVEIDELLQLLNR